MFTCSLLINIPRRETQKNIALFSYVNQRSGEEETSKLSSRWSTKLTDECSSRLIAQYFVAEIWGRRVAVLNYCMKYATANKRGETDDGNIGRWKRIVIISTASEFASTESLGSTTDILCLSINGVSSFVRAHPSPLANDGKSPACFTGKI